MMATSLFTVICSYLLLEVRSVEILSTKVNLPVVNDTEGVTKMICLFKNMRKTKEEVIGACASLGKVCSLEGYRNNSTIRKRLGCECLQKVIHNIHQIIDHSPGKFKKRRNLADQFFTESFSYSDDILLRTFSFVITLLLFSDADYSLNMSDVSGNQVTGYHLEGTFMNGAHSAAGYHGNGLHLDGIDDYLDLGFQGHNCLGNLTLCLNGLTVSMWLYPTNLTTTRQWYFGSAKPSAIGLQLVQENHVFRARLRAKTQKWLALYGIENRKWVLITVTWFPEDLLQLFIDGCLYEKVLPKAQYNGHHMHNTVIGKSTRGDEQYAAAIIDEFRFWEKQLGAEDIMSILFQ